MGNHRVQARGPQFAPQEIPQVFGGDLAGFRQAPGREIPQHDAHGQQRAVVPGLPFFSVLPLVVGQRRGQGLQVGLRVSQALPGQAQGHEIDEGGLAGAGVAQQHQAGPGVEFLQGGAAAHFARVHLAPLQALVGFGAQGEQRGVHRMQPYLFLGPIGRGRVDALQREQVGLLDEPGQVGVFQVPARGRGGTVVVMHLRLLGTRPQHISLHGPADLLDLVPIARIEHAAFHRVGHDAAGAGIGQSAAPTGQLAAQGLREPGFVGLAQGRFGQGEGLQFRQHRVQFRAQGRVVGQGGLQAAGRVGLVLPGLNLVGQQVAAHAAQHAAQRHQRGNMALAKGLHHRPQSGGGQKSVYRGNARPLPAFPPAPQALPHALLPEVQVEGHGRPPGCLPVSGSPHEPMPHLLGFRQDAPTEEPSPAGGQQWHRNRVDKYAIALQICRARFPKSNESGKSSHFLTEAQRTQRKF